MKKNRYFAISHLGISHGLNDATAAYLLAQVTLQADWQSSAFLILIYNILAFGGQFPLALWIDKKRQQKSYYLLSILLSFVALILYSLHLTTAAIIATGIGSALLHICGGSLLYQIAGNSVKDAGIFTSPGVLGLAIGGYIAFQQIEITYFLMLFFGLLGVVAIWLIPNTSSSTEKEHEKDTHLGVEPHNILMIVLLLAIAMRSAVWNIFQVIYAQDYTVVMYLAIAASIGKFAAGFITPYLNLKNYITIVLIIATVLLTFFADYLACVLIGIAMLQSVTPLALSLLYYLMPQAPATATGICLGLAIMLGGVVYYLPFSETIQPILITSLCVLALILYRKAIPTNQAKSIS
jgi:FSR family fosmidomycin resistance protein-like MFS transporter